MWRRLALVAASSSLALLFALPALAEEFSSTDFRVLEPVLAPAGYGTADDFTLRGSLSELSVGTSSAANFGGQAGFLFYPEVTVPTLTATGGNTQVSLSWTASEGFLGWTVSGYDIGQATVGGGPYSYTTVGNVTSSTATSLTNGVTYYFVVRPQDAFGNPIATSTEASATPSAAAGGGDDDDSGGGGGGGGRRVSQIFSTIPCTGALAGDLNCDGQVNLSDFSIFLAFSPLTSANNPADLNADAAVNYRDLSLLLARWTGSRLGFTPEPVVTPALAQAGGFTSLFDQPQSTGLAALGTIGDTPRAAPVPVRRVSLFDTVNRFIGRVVSSFWSVVTPIVNYFW